jgi:Flavin-binding monooxygenase-like
VALIGCGVSGMCFLHGLATRFKNEPENDKLPFVVCFERAQEPGGCWRSPPKEERDQVLNDTCWYDDVWLNVSKECLEFADYTFEEHFKGKQMPVFLPKKDAMGYLLSRTLTVDPHLYDTTDPSKLNGSKSHEMRFGTVITSVVYNDDIGEFVVGWAPFDPTADKHHIPKATDTEHFDYCIWAAGIRGKPRIPRSILNVLRTGGDIFDGVNDPDSKPTPFAGTILHSIHQASSTYKDAVVGKCIVLIGDSNSAEDIALHAIQIGVEKVHILSRSGYRDCVYMGSWPHGKDEITGERRAKVEVHIALPSRIIDNGRTLRCNQTIWNDKEEVYELDDDTATVTIQNVDTIIFCTGYVPNAEFLDEDLRATSEDLFSWSWAAPEDFKMKPNAYTDDLGDVKPAAELSFSGNIVPGIHRTILISNPKMMHIIDMGSEFPVLWLEALAWLCLAYITGDARTPSIEEMERNIHEQMMDEMNIAYLRWSMDRNYFEAMDVLGDNHWSDDREDPRCTQENRAFYRYFMSVIARDFKDSKYPVDFGTYEELNENGNLMVDLGINNLTMRHLLREDSPDSDWRTYRDVDPTKFRSIYTGQCAYPFPKPWLELDPDYDVTGEQVDG